MKNILRVAVLLLLVMSMLLTVVSCKKDAPPAESEEIVTLEDGKVLPFPKTNYKEEISIYYIDWGLYQDFFFAKEENQGTDMDKALAERADAVYYYLGITVNGFTGSSGGLQYGAEIANQVHAGTDIHQAVLTHCSEGLTKLIGDGCLLDFNDFDQISLDAEYWDSELMKSMEVQGNAYLGSNEFLLKDPNVIFFNKDVLADYEQLENPYKLVDDKKWTLDKMLQMAAQIDVQTEGTDHSAMTYGLVGEANWQAVAFADAADCNWLIDDGGYMTLNMSAANARYLDVFETLAEAADQNWYGLYFKGRTENELTMNTVKTLFSYESLQQAYKYRAKTQVGSTGGDSEVKFGILPYPKYDVDQTDYHSMNWSGFVVVPRTVKDTESVKKLEITQKALEALAFFSADTTVPAYYEKLLGTRLSDAPDDRRMLDIIFDGIVANRIFPYAKPGEGGLYNLFYGITNMLYAKLMKQSSVPTVGGLWQSWGGAGQNELDEYLA